MTAQAAQKLRRFVDMCNTFHLPVLSFVDEPGFMIGSASEKAATIRHGTAAIAAVMQSRVPWARAASTFTVLAPESGRYGAAEGGTTWSR